MQNEDVMNLPGSNNPVLLADGKMGMLLIYPSQGSRCGVQVHGEEEHRWIDAADLTAGTGGALRETGAPDLPPASAQADLAQMLVALDWATRGGVDAA